MAQGRAVAESDIQIGDIPAADMQALVAMHEVKIQRALFEFARDPANIRTLVELGNKTMKFGDTSRVIGKVVLMVVVPAELEPIERKFGFQRNLSLEKAFCGQAARIMSGMVKGNEQAEPGYELHIIASATSPDFPHRYNSGPTQAGAIASLVAQVIKPDLAISFGTSGGFLKGWDLLPGQELIDSAANWFSGLQITDSVLVGACYWIDRFRSSSATSFQWGVWGGPTIGVSDTFIRECGLRRGNCGSQFSYKVSEVGRQLIGEKELDIRVTDMETAAEAQVFRLAEINFMAFKVISNGVYPYDPSRQEKEYGEWKAQASEKASKDLFRILDYLVGKSVDDLTLEPDRFRPPKRQLQQ